MPLGVVTVTSTVPVLRLAGECAVIVVVLTTTMIVALTPPNFTPLVVLTPMKSVPVIVTAVPPLAGPLFGLTDVTVGGAMYVNTSPGLVADVPFAVVTCTSTPPGTPDAGDTAVTVVALTFTKLVAATPPKVTAVVPVRLVPVIVTFVPPLCGPDVGFSEVTVGVAL